jgi:hypothetical protein
MPGSAHWNFKFVVLYSRCELSLSPCWCIEIKILIPPSDTDTWHFGVDPDPDPAIFVIDLQDANHKNKFFKQIVLLITFFISIYIVFQVKSQKESQNSRNQGFSFYFCMVVEGSGSRRPKNMWIRWFRIRWIRIRIRIRIRNTDLATSPRQR